MARKRIVEEPVLKSWEDVDKALREIAEAQICVSDIEADMTLQINGIKEIAAQKSKPHLDLISKLERDLKDYTEDHRDELGTAKTKTLNFGDVGYRLSTSISVPTAKEKLAEIIRKLKARKMHDCIIVEEKVSKEILRKYGEDTVNAIGATWKQKDTFGYNVFTEKVEQLHTGL